MVSIVFGVRQDLRSVFCAASAPTGKHDACFNGEEGALDERYDAAELGASDMLWFGGREPEATSTVLSYY